MTHHVDSVRLHTLTEEALASRCPGLHSKEHHPSYPLNTLHFEENLCMCHLPEHSQKPRAVLLFTMKNL